MERNQGFHPKRPWYLSAKGGKNWAPLAPAGVATADADVSAEPWKKEWLWQSRASSQRPSPVARCFWRGSFEEAFLRMFFFNVLFRQIVFVKLFSLRFYLPKGPPSHFHFTFSARELVAIDSRGFQEAIDDGLKTPEVFEYLAQCASTFFCFSCFVKMMSLDVPGG